MEGRLVGLVQGDYGLLVHIDSNTDWFFEIDYKQVELDTHIGICWNCKLCYLDTEIFGWCIHIYNGFYQILFLLSKDRPWNKCLFQQLADKEYGMAMV